MNVEDLRVVQEIAATVTAAEAEATDRDARWPESTLRALQEAGLGGFTVSRAQGGRGHGVYHLALACETLGYQCASAAICFGMHCVASAVLSARATDPQTHRYLSPICRGAHLTTLALSEPGTGSHFYFPQCRLSRSPGGGLIVDGDKALATNAGHADSYVVSTTALDPEAEAGMFSCVIVPKEASGIEWGPPFHGLGMRGNASRGFRLNQVEIPTDNLLGRDGDQIWYVFQVVAPFFLMAMAGTYLGLARRALEVVVDELGRRDYLHSGRTPADEPVVQHRIGSLWAMVQRTRRLAYWAAEETDRGGPEALPALCSAKAEVANCAVDVVNECMTLSGGRAYRDGSILDRLLRDARAAHVMSPTTDLLRTWTGRALLGKPLLGS